MTTKNHTLPISSNLGGLTPAQKKEVQDAIPIPCKARRTRQSPIVYGMIFGRFSDWPVFDSMDMHGGPIEISWDLAYRILKKEVEYILL